jgi:uncharacterized protein
MQHFEGERSFAIPVESLWPKLRDAAFLADCVPDASVMPGATRDHAQVSVQPGFAFVRGSLDVTLDVIDAQEPSSIRYRATSKGVGSSSVVEATLALRAEGNGSVVHWSADVQSRGGLLKMMPAGLIRGAAAKIIDDVWTGIAARL